MAPGPYVFDLNLKPPTAPVAHKNGAATIQSTFVQGFCQRRKCQSEGGKKAEQ